MGPIEEKEQRNNGGMINVQELRNQERINKLTEEYNEKSAKLEMLKLEKDRLALETVPDVLLWADDQASLSDRDFNWFMIAFDF